MFKKYRRKGFSELRELEDFEMPSVLLDAGISVSEVDLNLSLSEFMQGKIARNPMNHSDQWYVAKKYVDENLELVEDTK